MNEYDNSGKRIDDDKRGTEVENLFKELIEKEGYRCIKASESQNKMEHWDWCTVKDGVYDRIDVKGIKERAGLGRTWFELQNIYGGIGWGRSEFMNTIVFEREDCFEFVNRAELLAFVEGKIKEEDDRMGEVIVYIIKDGLKDYQRYRRLLFKRDDRMVKVPFEDFEHLVFKRLKK